MKEYEDQLGDGNTKVLKIRNELSTCKKERDYVEEENAALRAQVDKLSAQLRISRNKADESLLQSNQAHEMSIALEEAQHERELLKQVGTETSANS